MSKFSGKCDFYDTVEMYGIDNIMKAKIYHKDKLMKFESEKDLIPFYPYIISSMGSEKLDEDNYKMTIYLSDESYVDSYERDSIMCKVAQCITYFRSKKYPQKDFEDFATHMCIHADNTDKAIFSAMLNDPSLYKKPIPKDYHKRAELLRKYVDKNFSELKTPMAEYYRAELKKEIEN